MKVAFLDRDGTINRDYPDNVWKKINVPELLDGSIAGMNYLMDRGYEIIIITNQYLIGEGIISMEQYQMFSDKLERMLNEHGIVILDTFYCPHARSEACDCCKPGTGLIRKALRKYPSIDLASSLMCGDSVSDRKCAEKMGIPFYGINLGERSIRNLSELRNRIK